MIANYIRGIKYFLGGFDSIQQPGVRRYAILPILVNILLFSLGIYFLTTEIGEWVSGLLPDTEGYWVILIYLVYVILGMLILIVLFFTFTLLTNLIASPFNGPLAAVIERQIEGHIDQQNGGSLIGDITSAISGELRKWLYYLFWAIPLLIITIIPGINFISPFLWFIFGAWMMAIEYMDYPMGNHNYTFPAIKDTLRQHRMLALGFGTVVMAFTMIPIINLVVMPAAVAGASKLWVR